MARLLTLKWPKYGQVIDPTASISLPLSIYLFLSLFLSLYISRSPRCLSPWPSGDQAQCTALWMRSLRRQSQLADALQCSEVPCTRSGRLTELLLVLDAADSPPLEPYSAVISASGPRKGVDSSSSMASGWLELRQICARCAKHLCANKRKRPKPLCHMETHLWRHDGKEKEPCPGCLRCQHDLVWTNKCAQFPGSNANLPKMVKARKRHINSFKINFCPATQNAPISPLPPPTKKNMCLVSWERTQKKGPT